MSLAPSLSPVLLTTALGFAYYRRIRSNFGRQPWRPTRTAVRMALLSLLLVSLLFAAWFVPQAGLAVSAGLAVGALLGWLALRHTQVEIANGLRYYTPNPWIGGALSLLLVGRLAWRMGSGVFSGGAAQFGQNASPLTLGIATTLVAYYLVNGIGLALRMRALAAPVSIS
jgi:hypothetical protein